MLQVKGVCFCYSIYFLFCLLILLVHTIFIGKLIVSDNPGIHSHVNMGKYWLLCSFRKLREIVFKGCEETKKNKN